MNCREDNPEWDATEYAHPAWWRGHYHTSKSFCQLVTRILNGQDDGRGTNRQPWHDTRRRLLALVRRVEEAENELEALKISRGLNHLNDDDPESRAGRFVAQHLEGVRVGDGNRVSITSALQVHFGELIARNEQAEAKLESAEKSLRRQHDINAEQSLALAREMRERALDVQRAEEGEEKIKTLADDLTLMEISKKIAEAKMERMREALEDIKVWLEQQDELCRFMTQGVESHLSHAEFDAIIQNGWMYFNKARAALGKEEKGGRTDE